MKRNAKRRIIWARRGVQTLSLIAFFVLAWAAIAARKGEPGPALKTFFFLDPLVLLATFLAEHAVPGLLLIGLVTVAVTLLLGRVFCGWFCPLGALHQAATALRRPLLRLGKRAQKPSGAQRVKYFLFIGLVVLALFGVHWIGLFDPFSFFYRSVAVFMYPGIQYGIEDSYSALYQADSFAEPALRPVYDLSRDRIFGAARPAYLGAALIGILFLGFVALNLYRQRFWCRYVCPLGAMLGAISKRPGMRLENKEPQCSGCGKCSAVCPAAAAPDKPKGWLPTECFQCWNCTVECPSNALTLRPARPLAPGRPMGKLDVSKRAMLASAAGGVGAALVLRATPQAQAQEFNPSLIRPPGARNERDFLQRCVQCGICMQVCPTTALHPCFLEAGLEGMWTPRLVPKIGYCDYECTRCTQACPTEAIQPLGIQEKQEVRIGLASVDVTRCLPYAYGQTCLVCEEHCPVPDKAIYMVEGEVETHDGAVKTLKQPHVDPHLCIGCGVCENVCPFEDKAAIRVTSANETRNPDNQPILAAPGGGGFKAPAGSGGPSPNEGGGEEQAQSPYG